MSNLSKLCCFPELNAETTFKFIYTSVHGVGQSYAEHAFAAFKYQSEALLGKVILVFEETQIYFSKEDRE